MFSVRVIFEREKANKTLNYWLFTIFCFLKSTKAVVKFFLAAAMSPRSKALEAFSQKRWACSKGSACNKVEWLAEMAMIRVLSAEGLTGAGK